MLVALKDPASRIDYGFDWQASYLDEAILVGSDWEITPAEAGGIVVEAAAFDMALTSVTLSGGIAGHVYRLTNRITLSDGQVDERSLTLRVEQI